MKHIRSVLLKDLFTKVTFWLSLFIGLLCLSVYLVFMSFGPDWRRNAVMEEKTVKTIQKGNDGNTKKNNDNEILTLVAKFEKPEIAKILLAAGVEIDAEEKKKLAAYLSDPKVFETVVPLSFFDVKDLNISLLYASAYSDNLKIIKALIDAGADVNVKDKDGTTDLMKAVLHNHLEVAKELVYADADINAKNEEGETPLMHAGKHGNTVAKMVLKRAMREKKSVSGGH